MVNPRDEANLVRFLIDLTNGVTPEDREDAHDRATARLRGDRSDPSPEAVGGSERTPEATSKRDGTLRKGPRWPVRPWWAR